MPAVSVQKPKNIGFEIRLEDKRVICPMGIESKYFRHKPNGLVSSSFLKIACAQCSRGEICQPKPRGKIYIQRPENKTLSQRREQL